MYIYIKTIENVKNECYNIFKIEKGFDVINERGNWWIKYDCVDSNGDYNTAAGGDNGAACKSYTCSFKNSRDKVITRNCDSKGKGTN